MRQKSRSTSKSPKRKEHIRRRSSGWKKPLDEQGRPKRDLLNPDPALRSVTGDRIVLAWDLKYNARAGEWSGGRIYDPETGKTYKVVFTLESPIKLKVRGYVGVPALGRTMNWTKIE